MLTMYIYTLSLHDALPIYVAHKHTAAGRSPCWRALVATSVTASTKSSRREVGRLRARRHRSRHQRPPTRSEEHTSELQSRQYLVCRLLLEKKNKLKNTD